MAESSSGLGPFGRWVESVIRERYDGVAGKLAKDIGVSLTTLTRGMESGTMGADTLLRLAKKSGRDASDVLRLADKADWADLIESCYGAPREESPEVREFAELIATPLPDDVVRSTLNGLQAFRRAWLQRSTAGSAPPATPEAGKRKRARPAARAK